MYRQWRECTKAMINGKAPKIKKHQKITKDYLRFAAGYFTQNRGASAEYQKNHGIIKVRNAFLDSRGLKGSDVIKEQTKEEVEIDRNVILVPVATIGCGKTTVAMALTKLFDWGHRQNDNITAKRGRAELFASACCMELANKPVVIADRNNHQRREREQLFKDIGKVVPDARYVALHYVHEDPEDDDFLNKVRKATQDRVLNRGDNHQTIQAGSKPRSEILGIMEGFIDRFQSVNLESAPDDNFYAVIDLDPTADSRTNLETVVTQLRKIFPKLIPDEPTAEMLDEAIRGAMDDYHPDVKHTVGGGNKNKNKDKNNGRQNIQNKAKKQPEVEYFSATIFTQSIQDVLKQFPDIDFLQQLQDTGRVQPNFHLTLIHRASAKEKRDIWDAYEKLRNEKPNASSLGTAEIKLK
jgi:tRNA ligase